LLPTPEVEPSALWAEALDSFEIYLVAQGRTENGLRNRLYSVRAMARHATSTGREPADITKAGMIKYLLLQYKDRRGMGRETLYQELKNFWIWWAAEYEGTSPMAGIPRPGGQSAVVPVLAPEQIAEVFKSCTGDTPAETLRNLAIVWLMLESGLRRFELCALDVADVDVRGRTALVRHGKGNRARVVVFGDSSAQALQRWLRKRGRDAGPLFVSVRGDRLTPGGLSQLLSRIKRRSGVQVRPHMLRHSWAHYSLESGMREHDVMNLAGWTSSAMLKRYGAALAQERAIAAGRAHQVGNALKARGGAA
jgi:site-specific recombinase XerD